MLFKVELENFHSIRDRQVVDLRVPASAPKDTNRLTGCWTQSNARVPKVVAVFGPNGSGKSNLLRALSFCSWFVDASCSNTLNDRLPFEPFYDQNSLNSPTKINVSFSVLDFAESNNDGNGVRRPFSYELEIGNKNGRQKVLKESMFFWPIKSNRKTCLFHRNQDGMVRVGAKITFNFRAVFS